MGILQKINLFLHFNILHITGASSRSRILWWTRVFFIIHCSTFHCVRYNLHRCRQAVQVEWIFREPQARSMQLAEWRLSCRWESSWYFSLGEPFGTRSILLHTYTYIKRSRGSSVGIADGYGLNDRGVGVRVPVGSRIFSSPRCPDRLWGPPMGTGGKAAGAWRWPLTSS
jgi:hypothetical protein